MAMQNLFGKACSFIAHGRLCTPNRVSVGYVHSTASLKSSTPTTKELQIPEKPKKPLSPFFRFIAEHRKTILASHPDMKATDVVRKCSEDWKNSHDTDKQKYELEYKTDMEAYVKKYLAYQANLTDEMKEALKQAKEEKKQVKGRRELRKKLKEENKPKRPMTSYMQYMVHQCDIRNVKLKDVMKDLTQEWKQLPEAEKKKYTELYEKDKAKYATVLVEWEKKMIKEGKNELVRKSTIDTFEPLKKKEVATPEKKMSSKKEGQSKKTSKD